MHPAALPGDNQTGASQPPAQIQRLQVQRPHRPIGRKIRVVDAAYDFQIVHFQPGLRFSSSVLTAIAKREVQLTTSLLKLTHFWSIL